MNIYDLNFILDKYICFYQEQRFYLFNLYLFMICLLPLCKWNVYLICAGLTDKFRIPLAGVNEATCRNCDEQKYVKDIHLLYYYVNTLRDKTMIV